MKRKVFFPLILMLPSLLRAATYYVTPTGSSSGPGTEIQSWNLSKANATAAAGDTVYLKAGTYTTGIIPANSGTVGNLITFKNFNSDLVIIRDTQFGVLIDDKSYIRIQGIEITACDNQLFIRNKAHHNEIGYCHIHAQGRPTAWDSSVMLYDNAQYNWIQHSTMSEGGGNFGTNTTCDTGFVMHVGDPDSGNSSDLTQFNLIENCVFSKGGHHGFGLAGKYNTVRNNYFHNEAWSGTPLRGNRNLYLNGTNPGTGFNLIEGNRFGYADPPCDGPAVGNAVISTPNNIFRYNLLYHHNAYGLGFANYTNSAADSEGSFNLIYNNTIFNSGYLIADSANSADDSAVKFDTSGLTSNRFNNNLYFLYRTTYTGTGVSGHFYFNEWYGNLPGQNPKFVTTDATIPSDKTDQSTPNLNLRSDSPAINRGGALTTVAATDAGSGTSLAVSNAGYFQDGTFAPAGHLQADWIVVGAVTNPAVQITSISGNTITLANSVNRNNGDSIWLYKKSDGVQVLFGSAPDAGALEYNSGSAATVAPAAPTNLRIKP